jgi:hypothetical protein
MVVCIGPGGGTGAARAVEKQAKGVGRRRVTWGSEQSTDWKQLLLGKDARGVAQTRIDSSTDYRWDVLKALYQKPNSRQVVPGICG